MAKVNRGKRISHETASVLDAVYWTNLALKKMFGIEVIGHEIQWGHRDAYRSIPENCLLLTIAGSVDGGNDHAERIGAHWEIEATHPLDFEDTVRQLGGWIQLSARCGEEYREARFSHRELEN